MDTGGTFIKIGFSIKVYRAEIRAKSIPHQAAFVDQIHKAFPQCLFRVLFIGVPFTGDAVMSYMNDLLEPRKGRRSQPKSNRIERFLIFFGGGLSPVKRGNIQCGSIQSGIQLSGELGGNRYAQCEYDDRNVQGVQSITSEKRKS